MTRSALGLAASLARAFVPETIRRSRLYQAARHKVVRHDRTYDAEYYAHEVEPAAAQSAKAMAASIVQHIEPKTVIDVGCGTGALLAAFRDCGCDVTGLEYSDAGLALCKKRGLPVSKFNIIADNFEGRFDVSVSFEVAEHLPASHADRYVCLLCGLSNTVIMSAATPGQGGTAHVNEQPHSYWIEKFSECGYSFDQSLSGQFSKHWRMSGIAAFYYKNVLVFRRTAYPA